MNGVYRGCSTHSSYNSGYVRSDFRNNYSRRTVGVGLGFRVEGVNGVLRCSAYEGRSMFMRCSGQRYVWGKDSYGAKVGFRIGGVDGVYRGGGYSSQITLRARSAYRYGNYRLTYAHYGVGFRWCEWCV